MLIANVSSQFMLQQDFDVRIPRSDSLDGYKQNFVAHANLIQNHNLENSTYDLAINAFSHLSDEILYSTKTGYIPDPEDPGVNETQPADEGGRNGKATAPANFDWRNYYGVVKPVQDQKSCGSCWAFAAIGAIEGQMGIYKRKYDKLSEQEVIECAKGVDGTLRGCNGGWSSLVYKHSLENKGITASTYKPYLATTANKVCSVYNLRTPSSIVSSWNFAPAKDEVTIKNWVYNYGPLYVTKSYANVYFCLIVVPFFLHHTQVTYYVANDFYYYKSGIYKDNGKLCRGQSSNHAVLLVGFGTENGQDYWICKNSWGE